MMIIVEIFHAKEIMIVFMLDNEWEKQPQNCHFRISILSIWNALKSN